MTDYFQDNFIAVLLVATAVWLAFAVPKYIMEGGNPLDQTKRDALDEFDEKFEEALSELLASGVTESEIDIYFGPSGLGQYIKERLREPSN